MYKPMDPKESPADFERRVRTYWDENGTAEKSINFRDGHPQFIFFEGPPTANGKPGVHHLISRAIKDTVCRYKTMKGFQVKRKAGWDTHGLPVEIEVEKILELNDKKAVEAYGIEKFNQKCRESVFTYEKQWQEMTRTMAYWIDLENPYITLHNSYIESVWWILNQYFTKGMIYKGHKIVPYCPKCGTPLSSHEVAQGYQDVEDPSVFVKFKAKDEENTYFLAWTTTPWTLISNAALAVHPEQEYVKVLHNEQYLILAQALLSVLDGDYEVVETYKGKDLEYREYEPLFNFIQPKEKAWFVAMADYVSMDDGTGIVHTAPAFGQDDHSLGQKYGLPVINPVMDDGTFGEVVEPWKGLFVKVADKEIIRDLKERGLLYKRQQILHSYPFCWRCKSPLIYYARDGWFIRTSDYKEQMIENNKKVNWYPDFVGEKRFGEWLENNIDWAISRDRFWGTPLNVWVCDKCGTHDSAGSIKELREKGKYEDGREVPEDIELHRPYIDEIVMTCPDCGGTMHRTPEVIDCWFDSGSMPFAQWHYPFENKERFDSELFPADFICEGIDQTRGWFYSLLAISTFVKGTAPYKNVLVNDLILDKFGKKMSKSLGNSVNPMEMMQKYGADANRWYLLYVSPPWVPTKFDPKGVEEVVNKFIGTMKNVYSFYATYANIDGFDAAQHMDSYKPTAEIDRWIVSRLNTLIQQVTQNNEQYDFTRSVRAIQAFIIDDLSNWYVRRSRRRYWALTMTDDKRDAYLTLYHAMVTVCRVMAPFAPYLAEEIYRNLTSEESVHLAEYPVIDQAVIDTELESDMQNVIDLVSLGRAARNECQIKVRQTLQTFYVPDRFKDVVEKMKDLILDEINVREIEYLKPHDELLKHDIKPNFKVLGPKVGKHMKCVAKALPEIDADHVLEAFSKNEPFVIECEGHPVRIEEEDLIFSIQQREGYVFASEKGIHTALSTVLTPELIQEGYARELINKIQFTRKEMDLDIMDRISVFFISDDEINDVCTGYADFIKTETLADGIFREELHHKDMKQWDINGKEVFLSITKVK